MLRRNVWNYDNLIFSNGCKTCSITWIRVCSLTLGLCLASLRRHLCFISSMAQSDSLPLIWLPRLSTCRPYLRTAGSPKFTRSIAQHAKTHDPGVPRLARPDAQARYCLLLDPCLNLLIIISIFVKMATSFKGFMKMMTNGR
jgi:hypothetical protein